MPISLYEHECPVDCLHCDLRFTVDVPYSTRYVQVCALQIPEYGLLLEPFFTSSDLVDGFKSSKCPLVPAAQDSDDYLREYTISGGYR